MNRIDFTLLGGMPLTQDRLKFMQDSYTEALGALAQLCGNKTILYGVVKTGGLVSSGWISYNGELIRFVGGSYDTTVVISETPTPYVYADSNSKDVEYVKTATCGAGGAFDFADLVPLLSLANVWLPGDIKMKHVDQTYEDANFDVDGYGINAEKGWRILSKAYPDTAGKTFVNKDDGDGDFDEVAKNGGEKEHVLTSAEQGSYTFKNKVDDIGGGGATVSAVNNVNGSDIPNDGGSNQGSYGTPLTKKPNADADAHNNLQPYYVILTLIKL